MPIKMNIDHLNNANSFQAFIFWFFGALGILIIKFLSWVMPKTALIVYNHIKDLFTKEMKQDLHSLKEELHSLREEVILYKKEKHAIENENIYLKQTILSSEDEEIFGEVKKILKRQENEKS